MEDEAAEQDHRWQPDSARAARINGKSKARRSPSDKATAVSFNQQRIHTVPHHYS